MNTFLVRVWVSADGTRCGTGLRGVVRHVATGVERAFRTDEEVLSVLRSAMTEQADARGASELEQLDPEVEK